MKVFDLSLIALVAAPEAHHGKLVRVVGWATFAFESHGIFVSREQAFHSKNGIWLDVKSSERLARFGSGEVIVEGAFDAESRGHLGMWSGTLKDIRRLQTWGAGPMTDLLA